MFQPAFGELQPMPMRDRAHVDGPEAELVLLRNASSAPLSRNQRKSSGFGRVICRKMDADSIGKAFAHPLVAIATESHRLAPPLVRDLVRRHHLPIHILTIARPRKCLLRLV